MGFKKITFKNGLRIVLVPRPQSLAASVLILVEAGAEYETKNINGLSHFLEHMVFKGTVKRPKVGQIAEELSALGAQTDAFTSYEYTGYWVKAVSRKLPKILDIVSDLYLNPIFNPKEIDKERGVIVEELNMYEDDPIHKVRRLFVSLLYGDQPAGWEIVGRKEVIRHFKRDNFLKYRAKRYIAPSTVVVVAGDFDHKKVMGQIYSTFGHLKRHRRILKKKTTEGQSKSQIVVDFKASEQSHFVLGVPAFDIFDKRRYALHVLADILGGGMSSRLFKKVRDELGAAYYIGARPTLSLDHGYLAIFAGVDHSKIEQVIGVVLEECRRLKRELVSTRELRRHKDHLIGNIILELESSDELAAFYGEQELLTRKMLPPRELVARVQGVSAEGIRSVARSIFRSEKLNLAVIGPYKNAAKFKKILKL